MKKLFASILVLLAYTTCLAQYNNNNFSIAVNAIYTTTAKVYLSPNSPDPITRNRSYELSDILNPGIDIRYKMTESILLGLSSEYMKKIQGGTTETVFTQTRQTLSADVEDGFLLIPVELSLYYLIPFSTEQFKFLMGGGGALYFGEHLRKLGDAEVSNLTRKTAYGIHVMLSMDYLPRDYVSIRFEMKFRDPQFNVTSKYTAADINYQGEEVTVTRESFASKINVDGVTFILGTAFHF